LLWSLALYLLGLFCGLFLLFIFIIVLLISRSYFFFIWIVEKSTHISSSTSFLLFARYKFEFAWMIKSLKSSMTIFAIKSLRTFFPRASLFYRWTIFCRVFIPVRLPSKVLQSVSVNASAPIVFWMNIWAPACFIPEHCKVKRS